MTREDFLLSVVTRIDNELDKHIRDMFDRIRFDNQYPADNDFNKLTIAVRIYKTVKRVNSYTNPAPSDVASLVYDVASLFESIADIPADN